MAAMPERDLDMTEGSDTLARTRMGALNLAPAEVPSLPSFPSRQERAQSRLAGLASQPGTLLHAQPMTFRQAHARHRECAGHYQHPAAAGLRQAYGWLHMAFIKAPLNYLEWATQSPLGGLIHVLLGLGVYLALRLGGYL
jgi:hypothetical protein